MKVAQRSEEVSGQVRRAKILVMDDEEVVRGVAGTMLTEMGHETVPAGDGRENVNLYQEATASGKPFDLVIMDLTIAGGIGGEDAVQEILAQDSGEK